MHRISMAAVCSVALLTLSSGFAHAEQPAKSQEASTSTAQAIFGKSERTAPQVSRAALDLERSSVGKLVLTSHSGVMVVDAAVGMKLFEVLRTNGFSLSDFETDEGGKLTRKDRVNASTNFLFQVEYEGKVEKIELAPPVEKRSTATLLVGQTEVAAEGQPGVAIKTTVTLDSSADEEKLNGRAKKKSAESIEETLTIVRAPEPRVVLVGTGEEEPLTLPTTEAITPEALTAPAENSVCSNGSSVPSTVDPSIIAIHKDVCALAPEIMTYGTYRGYCTYTCDHRDGIAVDIMVSGELGRNVARYLAANASRYNINNLIYEQEIWTTGQPYWRAMSDRGSITANHFDHVHVSLNRS